MIGDGETVLPASAKYLALFALLTVAATLVFVPPIPQWDEYHLFADDRTVLGIPNGLNVLSNAGFLLIGAWGLWKSLARPWTRGDQLRVAYMLMFAGVFLTAMGSAWYHLEPDNQSLVWDRLPMSITAMALLTTAVSEFVSPIAARRLLLPLLFCGVASVVWWGWTESRGVGDLRAYGLVQFLPGVLILVMIVIFRRPSDFILAMVGMMILYGVAKLCEMFDHEIYDTLGQLSGHSLKHLFAAAAAGCLLLPLYRGRPGPQVPPVNL